MPTQDTITRMNQALQGTTLYARVVHQPIKIVHNNSTQPVSA